MANPDTRPWYSGITRYQWLVLVIAAAGWAFDQYESQVFVITKDYMLPELAGTTGAALNDLSEYLFAVFLLGSAFGGLLAGSLADRFGRRPLLIATILFYSTFLRPDLLRNRQVATRRHSLFRGGRRRRRVGGWSEPRRRSLPTRARTYAGAIFHATGQLGFWIAALVGIAVGAQWRYAYLVGILPALLTFLGARPRARTRKMGSESHAVRKVRVRALPARKLSRTFIHAEVEYRAILGCLFAGTGLATFWAVMVAGQDLTRDFLTRIGTDPSNPSPGQDSPTASCKLIGAPSACSLSVRSVPASAVARRSSSSTSWHSRSCRSPALRRRRIGNCCCYCRSLGSSPKAYHSGYAVYFPELFPTHLRATGTSFCFNGGRIVAIPALFVSAWLKGPDGIGLHWAVTVLASLYLLGAALMLMLPETNRQELPE